MAGGLTTEEKLRAARAALQAIADRGVVVCSGVQKLFGECRVCKRVQEFSGRCANRDCPTAVAAAGLAESA